MICCTFTARTHVEKRIEIRELHVYIDYVYYIVPIVFDVVLLYS